jgi:hypothetical protein
VFVSVLGSLVILAAFSSEPGGPVGAASPPDALEFDRPVVIVVRGWLWDPGSRRESGPLVWFPSQVNRIMEEEYETEVAFLQYPWSRIPTDIGEASASFSEYAGEVARQAGEEGRCINFMGHSAGAAMVYRAAAEGVPMGYMGTLGLPTRGAEKPGEVTYWANFYTTSHIEDVAGLLWGGSAAADVNVDLRTQHKDLWARMPVVEETVEGIATAWESCP